MKLELDDPKTWEGIGEICETAPPTPENAQMNKGVEKNVRALIAEILTVPGFRHHWIPKHLEAALDHGAAVLTHALQAARVSAVAETIEKCEQAIDTTEGEKVDEMVRAQIRSLYPAMSQKGKL